MLASLLTIGIHTSCYLIVPWYTGDVVVRSLNHYFGVMLYFNREILYAKSFDDLCIPMVKLENILNRKIYLDITRYILFVA